MSCGFRWPFALRGFGASGFDNAPAADDDGVHVNDDEDHDDGQGDINLKQCTCWKSDG